MEYTKYCIISRTTNEQITKLLTTEPKSEKDCFGEDERHSEQITFDNGIKMYIDLCGVKFEDNSSNLPWTQAVLYTPEGSEICFTDPSDEFLGEWSLDYNDDTYTVIVVVHTSDEEFHEILLNHFGDEEELNNITKFSSDMGSSFNDALIGISHDNRLIYSYEKMIEWLMEEDNISSEDAIDYIEYNVIRSLPYAQSLTENPSPIVMYDVLDI